MTAITPVHANENSVKTSSSQLTFSVYKDPNCGCCGNWVKHMKANNFNLNVHNATNLDEIKAEQGIAPRYRSCHTAITNTGYVFEGHVPAKFILKFLQNPPLNAIGLSVPAMPMGAPGMEMGDRFLAYRILLLNKDGSSSVYATIKNKKEQQ